MLRPDDAGELQMVGAPVGTVVSVEDLFYNVPGWKLSTPTTERRHIDEMVTRYALAVIRLCSSACTRMSALP